MNRPHHQRGSFRTGFTRFGASVLGAPLEAWLPSGGPVRTLLVAGQHGEEPEGTFILSRALRSLADDPLQCAVVLAANPDGLMRGTRANANGVDLNRNFPTADWQPAPVRYHWRCGGDEVELSPGSAPASEPETIAFMELVERCRPERIVTLHAPLACIDDPRLSPLGREISEATGLPLVDHIGYPTPGSLGTWAAERDLHVITYELPRASLEELCGVHGPVLRHLLAGDL
jgi:protein MpaA